MADILREIDEELERERMASLWHKHKIAIFVVLGLIVFGTASYSAWTHHNTTRDVTLSVALGKITDKPGASDEEKLEGFLAFANANKGTGQGVLARMSAAGIMMDMGDARTGDAVRELGLIINDPVAPALTRDFARLQRAALQLGTGDIAQLRQELGPLAAEGQPWRFTARMLQGSLFARAGEYATAQSIFKALGEDAQAPVNLKDNARMLALYYSTKG